MEPEDLGFGEWMAAGELPETMIAILAELGRFYLPWVSRAAVDGKRGACIRRAGIASKSP